MRKHLDAWSLAVTIITLVLFVGALFARGFTHDLLLEAGIFLVSVKLITMAYKSSVANAAIQKQLAEILEAIRSATRRDPE